MPKIISMNIKMEWLHLHEDEGKSAVFIRNGIEEEKKPSLKTIKDGIEAARKWRDGKLAHADILKDSLREHHKQLIAILESILGSVQLPTVNLSLDLPILLPGAKVIYEDTKGLVVVLDAEDRLEWELLIAHLGKRDKLWPMLSEWKKALKTHIQVRRELKRNIKWMIESNIKIRLVDSPTDLPFVYLPNTVSVLYNEALNIALGNPPQTPLEERIVADSDSGEVMYESGHILAKTPGEEEKYRQDILAMFDKLKESAEVKEASHTYIEAEITGPRLRRTIEEIKLLGMIPGGCRVCKRLGIY